LILAKLHYYVKELAILKAALKSNYILVIHF